MFPKEEPRVHILIVVTTAEVPQSCKTDCSQKDCFARKMPYMHFEFIRGTKLKLKMGHTFPSCQFNLRSSSQECDTTQHPIGHITDTSSSYRMHTVASPVGNLRSLDRILTNLHVPEDLPVRTLAKASRKPVEWLYYCYSQYGIRRP